MKKSFIYFSALAIVIMLSGNAYSQNSFSLHAGPSFPLADFGDDDLNDEDAGCAGVGLSLGGNYVFQLNDKGLGLYLGADFDINGLKSSVKDDIEDNLASGVDIEFYKFINVPVIAGLNYMAIREYTPLLIFCRTRYLRQKQPTAFQKCCYQSICGSVYSNTHSNNSEGILGQSCDEFRAGFFLHC